MNAIFFLYYGPVDPSIIIVDLSAGSSVSIKLAVRAVKNRGREIVTFTGVCTGRIIHRRQVSLCKRRGQVINTGYRKGNNTGGIRIRRRKVWANSTPLRLL